MTLTTRRGFNSSLNSKNQTSFTNKLQSRSGLGNNPGYFLFALKTPQTYGIQALDMRSMLQQRVDNRRLMLRNQLPTDEQIIAIPASELYFDSFSIMNGCADAAFFKADIAARIMKLPASRFLRTAGGVTGGIGLGLNIRNAIINPTFNNYAKAGAGLVLLGVAAFGGAPLVPLVIAGNVGMIAWDLGEGLYEHLKKNKR